MSRRIAILDRIAELLAASGRPADVLVQRTRSTPLTPQHLPATLVYPLREDVESMTHAPDSQRRAFIVRVEHRVMVPGDHPAALADPPDDALDALLEWATTQLLQPDALAGLAEDVEELRTVWAFSEGDLVFGAAGQDFRVEYWTTHTHTP